MFYVEYPISPAGFITKPPLTYHPKKNEVDRNREAMDQIEEYVASQPTLQKKWDEAMKTALGDKGLALLILRWNKNDYWQGELLKDHLLVELLDQEPDEKGRYPTTKGCDAPEPRPRATFDWKKVSVPDNRLKITLLK